MKTLKRLLLIIAVMASAISMQAQIPTISQIIQPFMKSGNARLEGINSLIQSHGYESRFNEPDGSYTKYVFSRNCRVVREDSRNGMEFHPDYEGSDSSIIVVSLAKGGVAKAMDVQVYTKAQMKKWVEQLRALGYKSTDESGIGNQGRAWVYEAKGRPRISIWNDHYNTYILTIGY